ncbi:sensor histidine kinase [Actinomadura rudentiformis]|uniref:Signal transduction histidine kinase subgroup 3 dimerisation and phosphoacceptor domain-containing protein n=1 Tax=Actinomadura rudentiformis TaxID=359158 RepID=A0A6H9YFR9_9ACTN|nr:hypothetical protein [Actinomadura rudentiformis]KAB2340585.1 hypothetical protein F8566_44480 [Actinomadura rudentiformis]
MVEVHRQSSRFIQVATAGAVAYSVLLPLLNLHRVATHPSFPGHTEEAAVVTACYLPLQVWIVRSKARGDRTPGQAWGLVVVAALIFGAMPFIGVGWLGALCPLAGLVLIVIRAPWSFLTYAALAAVPAPAAIYAFDQPEWAVYFTLAVLVYGTSLSVPIFLIGAVRQLENARRSLADEAVVRERLRIDGQLRQSVGPALEGLVAKGQRRELATLVEDSRRTLAEVRRMVTRYQEVTLRAELETAATLLSAAGIETNLILPEGLDGEVPDALRAELRCGLSQLLENQNARHCVIKVIDRDGTLTAEVTSG